MVRRDGAGGDAGSKSRSNGTNGNLRNRIEGFGNGPMPPPVADTFEDRLHNALAADETIGEWYTSARTSMDAVANAFDSAVNNIADAIEETVSAVVGDDDMWDDPAPKSNGQRRQKQKNEGKVDDGERSGIKWDEVVASLIEGGDLETFVLEVRAQCVNLQEEKEVGDVLAKRLVDADKTSSTLRVLYIMQAIVDADLPNVRDQIRIKAAARLEKLQTSATTKALAVEVLGRAATAGSSEQNASSSSSAKAPPVDLVNLNDSVSQPAAKASAASSKASAASSKEPLDLLDASAGPATGGAVDLLDTVSLAPVATSAPAKVKAQEPADLLSLGEPASAVPSTIPGLQPPPKSKVSPLSPPTSQGYGGTTNLVDLMSTTSSAPTPQVDLFANFAAPQPLNSTPVGGSLLGMSQGSLAASDKRDDGFNPNQKQPFLPGGGPTFSPPAAPLKPIIVKTTPASSDPFASLVNLPGASGPNEGTKNYSAQSMDSMTAWTK